MKYSDTKILKLLQKIKDKENISYAKIEEMIEEVFKPFIVVVSNPNGDCYYEARFETLEDAINYFDWQDAPSKRILQRGNIHPLVDMIFDECIVGKEIMRAHHQTEVES